MDLKGPPGARGDQALMVSKLCQFELWLLLSLTILMLELHSCLSVPPTLRSSVDGYKTVCPGEEIHFVCSVQNSNLLTWKSTEYIGRNAVIEFDRDFDRLGEGKSTSLPNRETTLLQLASRTNQELEATLRIVIVSSVVNASVECANDVPEAKQKTLLLADSAPKAPSIQLVIRNITNLYYFSLTPPPNRSRVDIDFYKATAVGDGLNETFMLHNDTSEFMLPLLYQYDAHNFTLEVIAVDRCGQQSPAAMVVIPANNLTSLQPIDCSDNAVTTIASNTVKSDGHRSMYSSILILLIPILMHILTVIHDIVM